MEEVCILSHHGDVHAEAVAWGLRKLGQDVLIIDSERIFDKHRFAVLHAVQQPSDLIVDGRYVSQRAAVWMHKPFSARLGGFDAIHESDLAYSRRICRRFSMEVVSALASRSFCVDRPGNALRAELPSVQIRLAAETGLETPKTLLSNDSDLVAQYVKTSKCKTCALAYLPSGDGDSTKDGTGFPQQIAQSEVSLAMIGKGPVDLRELVPADEKITAICIGRNVYALGSGLLHQDAAGISADRNVYRQRLPEHIVAAILKLMQGVGLRHGAIELARQGMRYHFVKLEPGSSWLSLCDDNELPLLDCFVKYLAEKREDYLHDGVMDVGLSDYCREKAAVALDVSVPAESVA